MNKHKKLVSILAGIMAAVMLLSFLLTLLPVGASAKTSSEIKEDISDTKDEISDVQAQLAELESQMNANWTSIEEMVEQKNNIDQQIALLYTEIDMINEQIRSYTLLIAENQAQLDEAEAKLAELNEKNKERIRAMEEEGEISFWSVLFKANSFTELIDCVNMMEEIQEADQRRMAELSAAAEEVAAARAALEEEKTALEASRAELETAQADLETRRAEADELLAKLNEDQQALEAMEAQYEAEEAALAAELAQLNKDLTAQVAKEKAEEEERRRKEEEAKREQEGNNGGGNSGGNNGGGNSGGGNSGGSSSSSGWGQPCAYVKLTSPYGYRTHPTTGKYTFHHGVDLANVKGTPIYATRSGIVTVATYGSTYGYYVTINHGDGYSSLYAHMTQFIVEKGDYVEKGQLIGYMGSTGRSTGSHLHFSIYYNGSSVNPMDYID